MKKRLFKSSLSVLLAVCMLFSMTAVGLNAVSAATAGASTGSFEKMLLDKMSEIRLRKACNAVVAISEAAEENGNDALMSKAREGIDMRLFDKEDKFSIKKK